MPRFVRALWPRSVNGEGGGLPLVRRSFSRRSLGRVRAEAAYRLGIPSDLDTRTTLEAAITKDADSEVRQWAKRGT